MSCYSIGNVEENYKNNFLRISHSHAEIGTEYLPYEFLYLRHVIGPHSRFDSGSGREAAVRPGIWMPLFLIYLSGAGG
jgi:hypothetical protein